MDVGAPYGASKEHGGSILKTLRILVLGGLATLTLAACAQPGEPSAGSPPPTSCEAAYAYLADQAAPGYSFSCGAHSALGHYGYTMLNPKVIHIACPAPFVYMNEAYNSWLPDFNRPIDPYGQGTPSEQAFCNNFR